MAKTTAPALSFGASGQIASTMVYSRWKGRQYVRRHVVPSNPQTSEQSLTRNAFTWLQSVYKVAPSIVTDVWDAYAKGLVMTGRNGFTKQNLPTLRPASDIVGMVMSPGALGGLPPASLTPTGGVGTMSLAVVAPSVLPQGWTIYSAQGAIIRSQDPQSGVLFNIQAGEDLTSAYAIAFSSLGAHAWECFAWLKWTRPDGQFAYSPSLHATASST